jgi:hypothetical protein
MERPAADKQQGLQLFHALAQRFVSIGEPYFPNQENMFLRERSSYE